MRSIKNAGIFIFVLGITWGFAWVLNTRASSIPEGADSIQPYMGNSVDYFVRHGSFDLVSKASDQQDVYVGHNYGLPVEIKEIRVTSAELRDLTVCVSPYPNPHETEDHMVDSICYDIYESDFLEDDEPLPFGTDRYIVNKYAVPDRALFLEASSDNKLYRFYIVVYNNGFGTGKVSVSVIGRRIGCL